MLNRWLAASTLKPTTLSLAGNRIGKEGATALASAMTADGHAWWDGLTVLDLGGPNDIGCEGARALGAALPKLAELDTLVVGRGVEIPIRQVCSISQSPPTSSQRNHSRKIDTTRHFITSNSAGWLSY